MNPSQPGLPRPTIALPARPIRWRGLWALPLLLSLALSIAVMVWLRNGEHRELDEQRQELISDALTVQSEVSSSLAYERERLGTLIKLIALHDVTADGFGSHREVSDGLKRFWISLTWLDAKHRIVAHAAAPELAEGLREQAAAGLSAHVSVAFDNGQGSLVARYSPGAMLSRNVPWWLARKYDVRMIDSFDNVIATAADPQVAGSGQSYRVSLDPTLDGTWLELTVRNPVTRWYRTLPVALVGIFMAMVGVATLMLRRQVRAVSMAETAWRTEAAWRGAMEDSLTVGLRARALDGRMLYVNRAFENIVGYSAEELVGHMPPMPYWPPDAIAETMQRLQRNLAGQAPREGYEARWRHRDGHMIDVMQFEAPLVDASGKQIGWMGSILDITERKQSEERERRQVEALANNARLTMLGEIASTLAHELNQPLTAIVSYNAGAINYLKRQPQPDPVLSGALQRLGEQAAHAGSIVQRIREFLTRRTPRREACDINGLVRDALKLMAREMKRRDVHVGFQAGAALPEVRADRVLIEQIVINLVRNAADALAACPGERRIEVESGVDRERNEVFIAIADNGKGLGDLSVEQLCSPFFSTKPEGMGMGLAICRSIVEAHQGRFTAGAAKLGGANFTVWLPLASNREENSWRTRLRCPWSIWWTTRIRYAMPSASCLPRGA